MGRGIWARRVGDKEARNDPASHRATGSERTFCDRPPGAAFWYENSNGLAEIAVNQGRADRDLGLAIGISVEIVS
jgi:S-adenosylmethionine hydrolase